MATCPRCQHKFRFRVVDDLPPAGQKPAEPVPSGSGPAPFPDFTGADPMAAQRAAAAQAWQRIQGVKPDVVKDGAAAPDALKDEAAPASRAQNQAQNQQPVDSAPGSNPEARPEAGPDPWSAPSGQEPWLAAPASPVPFEDLPRHGFFPGLWGTVTAVLKTPSAFFQAMPVSGGMARPLIFHLLLAEFMVLCQYLWGLTSLGTLSQYTGSQELMDMGMGMAGAGPILILVFYPLLLILRLMIMTGIIHLLLRVLFRFAGTPGSGAEATFRVLCYSAAPLALGVIPFFGPLLGGLWSIGLTVIGLKEAHRTRSSVALFAVLVPILMLLAALLGLMQAGLKV